MLTFELQNSTHYTAQVNLYNSMSSQLLPDDTTRVPTVRLKVPIMCTFRRSIIIISSGYSTTGYALPGAMVTLSMSLWSHPPPSTF